MSTWFSNGAGARRDATRIVQPNITRLPTLLSCYLRCFLPEDITGDVGLFLADVNLQHGDGQFTLRRQRVEGGVIALVGVVHSSMIKIVPLEREVLCLCIANVGILRLQPTRDDALHEQPFDWGWVRA